MIDAALLALRQSLTPPFRTVLMKSVGLALLLLIMTGVIAQRGLVWLIAFDNPWLDLAATIAGTLGVIAVLIFAIGPVVSLIAGFFADEIAETVERTHYPADAPGTEQPLVRSLIYSIKFAGLVVLVNLCALLFIFIPGVNVMVWWLANGYLLGREYFELAAMRFRTPQEARTLRRQHRIRVLLAGMLVAAFMAVPLLNLMTPIVATAFMVHIHKQIGGRRAELIEPARSQ